MKRTTKYLVIPKRRRWPVRLYQGYADKEGALFDKKGVISMISHLHPDLAIEFPELAHYTASNKRGDDEFLKKIIAVTKNYREDHTI